MKIPLFDIDWTLLEGGNKTHNDAFDYAFRTVYRMPEASKDEIKTDGMIDTQIVIEILKLHNVPEEKAKKEVDKAMRAMEEYYTEHEDEGKCIVLPGVKELLAELKKNKLIIGLLTGNIEGIAWKKVARAGIKDFFDFGAFGNLALRRVELIDIAAKRARKQLGLHLDKSDLFIVGDSPLDIACAKEGGIQVVAVASGVFDEQQLTLAGADLVLKSLEDQKKFFSFLHN